MKKAYKSKTMWLAGLLAVTQPVLETFPQLKTLLGDNYGISFAILAGIVGLLRFVTTQPLGKQMKTVEILLVVVCVTLVVVGSIYGVRYINEITTPIKVHEVKPNVFCATMATADGAAIDCWKEDK